MRYSVIGLGKLGSCLAAAIASRGHSVIGVDVDPAPVEAMNAGLAPVLEPGLPELISANRERLRATHSAAEAVLESDVTFVIVPTPSDERGAFSLDYAASAFEEIGGALARKDTYHTVVLTSTVLPGATRYGLLPILERASGKRCGTDFGLCYGPEFIALGSVIRDLLTPDFSLIGEFDIRSGDSLEEAYREILPPNSAIRRMSLENAELTKLALNAFVTMKITYANMLTDLCERIPGGDVDAVTDALGLDRRVGRNYLTGGLGYGGPCFPRDNLALMFLARALGTRAELAETTHRMNVEIVERAIARLRPEIGRGSRVAVLGLAFKPTTPVVEESQGVMLARALSELGAEVLAFDPLVPTSRRPELPQAVRLAESLEECVANADIVLVTTPDRAFAGLTPAHFRRGGFPVLVMDFWRLLDGRLEDPNIQYVPAGRSVQEEHNAACVAALWAPDIAHAL